MKTDSFIHRFFREFPGAFFVLIGQDEQKAEGYQFTAVEVKDIGFRFDGIFLPEAQDENIYCVEAQFYQAPDFYPRFFGKIFAYLQQKQPTNDWRAIVIYPNEAVDTGIHHHYREFFESGRLRRVFLANLSDEILERFPLNLLKIIIDSKEKVLSTAEKLIRQLPEQIPDKKTQEIFIELLFNLLLNKLPQLSREEIKEMYEPLLSDIRKSRFYQEVAEEKAKEIAKTMLKKNFGIELISEITGLSQEEILAISQELRDGKN